MKIKPIGVYFFLYREVRTYTPPTYGGSRKKGLVPFYQTVKELDLQRFLNEKAYAEMWTPFKSFCK